MPDVWLYLSSIRKHSHTEQFVEPHVTLRTKQAILFRGFCGGLSLALDGADVVLLQRLNVAGTEGTHRSRSHEWVLK